MGWESYTPRGKIYWLKQLCERSFLDKLLGRKIEPNDAWIKSMFTCTTCARCETYCHVDIKFSEYWDEVKEWMIENGYGPLENHKMMWDSIQERHNPLGPDKPHESRDEWVRDELTPKPKADIIFYPGCVTSYNLFQLQLSILKVLNTAKVDFTTLGKDEWCCGAIQQMTGQVGKFEALAQHNVEAIEQREATRVVTGCPGCYRTLNKYSKYVGKLNFEVIHTSEFFAELIDEGKLEFKKGFKNKKVTYHDPCELGRLSGIYEPPRKIIESIPDIEFEELPHNKKDSKCCGAGGALKAIDEPLTNKIGARKVDSVIELGGVDAVITGCPNCQDHIGVAIQDKKDYYKTQGEKFKMKIMDVADLVAKVI